MKIESGSIWKWRRDIDDVIEPQEIKIIGISESGMVLYEYRSGRKCHKIKSLFLNDFKFISHW